ncbi:hypothetical protein [Methanoculleus chikugoensis]|uniref:hypothetical protein n=1 Tax=Methanoculleus chikugoensis TaxID=118126 RepID=UPI000AFD4D0D|nr:hypothetical protein [Methanoculleus chikugoensis]
MPPPIRRTRGTSGSVRPLKRGRRGLRFTSIGYESCDLVIREELAAGEGVAALVEAARSPGGFRAYLRSIGRDPGDGDAPGVFSV